MITGFISFTSLSEVNISGNNGKFPTAPTAKGLDRAKAKCVGATGYCNINAHMLN
jgi:hypothetical protein